MDKVYVTVRSSNATLQQLFTLVEGQTDLYFAYDENEVDLSRKVNLKTGQQLLTGLLELISRQTGLHFTQVKLAILVSRAAPEPKTAATPTPQLPVKGIVRDAGGNPLAGATIIVKGTLVSVQTDAEGRFSVDASQDATLLISYIGYRTEEVAVNGRSLLEINIKELATTNDAVVVMGYQTQKRSDISGAVSIVNVEGVAKQPIGFADQALQGKAAGVRITQSTGQPGDGVAIRIRGVGTINNNDPLFIIDGVPTKDGINFLSANDIATITVLKDAASAAIYGARSSNGVIVITTKGGKPGKTQFNYSGYGGLQTHGTLTKMVNTAEYVTLYNEAVANDNVDISNPVLKRSPIPPGIPMANTDWLGAIFQHAPMQSHELSVNGGTDKTQYFISGNYFKQDGIILNSWFEKSSMRSKLNIELSDRLSIANNINISFSDKNSVGSSGDGYGGNGGSVVRYALFRTPAIPVFNPDGSYTDLPQYPAYFGDGYNPVALAKNTDNKERQYRVFGDFYAEYKISKSLKFKSDIGADVFVTEDKRFDMNYGTNLRINSPSVLTETNTTNENLIWNNTLRFNKVINGVHNLSILAGTEAISNNTVVQAGSDHNFPDQLTALRFLGNGLNITTRNVSEAQFQSALFSLFGNINYSYRSLYLLSFNVRRDGSSRFGPDNKYGNFFSGSLGWNMHNEHWFQDALPAISKLKMRASFGQLGNQEIGDYPWATILGRGYNYPFGSPPAINEGYAIASRGNQNVQWEAATQADAGLDIGVLHDRLSLSVDYFIKTTTKMLIPVPLPQIGGSAVSPFENAGSVENRGLEIELNYSGGNGRLKYNINANFATLANKVLSLNNTGTILGGRIDNGIYATLTTVGHPIGSFYLLQAEGVFQNNADIFKHANQGNYIRPGDVKFKDQDGDGFITDKDRTFLGSAIPKFTYGLTTNLEWGNVDLSVFFQGAYGNKLYMQVNQDIEGFYRPFNMTQRVFDERWHGEGTSNSMPRVSWLGSTNNKTPSSRFLEDGSYVRLKNLQIGYSIPGKWMGRAHIKGLRFYVTSQNLLTITKYTGLDPEMHVSDNVKSESNRGDLAAGIDWGTYPSARSYIFGANLNF
jgi:TonB-dependent starch-binding outer membrane protein SusC